MQGTIIDVAWLQGSAMNMLLGLVFLTMLIIYFLPKITRVIPSSLAAILVVTGLVLGFDLDTKVVGDVASISGGRPPLIEATSPTTLVSKSNPNTKPVTTKIAARDEGITLVILGRK